MRITQDRPQPVRRPTGSNQRTTSGSPFFRPEKPIASPKGPDKIIGAGLSRHGATPLAGPDPDKAPLTTKAAVRALMTDGSRQLARQLRTTYPDANLCLVMRAGLGMLAGFQSHYPEADVGFIGITSPKEIGRPARLYLSSLPTNTADKLTILLEPAIAEAKASLLAAEAIAERGGRCIVAALVSTRLGAQALADHGIPLYCNHYCQINEDGILTPNLGDIGDRLWGEHEEV